MRLRFGPGPVFVYESIAAARRWQSYAWRSLFVLSLLVALGVVWRSFQASMVGPSSGNDLRLLALLGQRIYGAIACTQIALVLLAAPAATAGAVCLDRIRGGLEHMLVTDLSDTEIVLGKLAARLLPVAALVASGLPVLALSTLLGGVVPESLVTLTLVTAGVAVFGSALALALSVRASKTHDVLIAVYAVDALWLLALPAWYVVAAWWRWRIGVPPRWFVSLNPFAAAFAPQFLSGPTGWSDTIGFLAPMLVLSALLLTCAVLRLRAPVQPPRRRSERWSGLLQAARNRLISWWSSPQLDGNPVLWREWHRSRPSRLARGVMSAYIALVLVGLALGVRQAMTFGVLREGSLLITSFLAVEFGLLILSATAPTALTEERVRGSLDVLMSTPLPTHAIVLGKWWAVYRRWLPLALVPAVTSLFFAVATPDRAVWLPSPMNSQAVPLGTLDRLTIAVLPTAFTLAHAAAATSLGLALATWIRRPGLAITLNVAAYLFMLIGWVVCVETVIVPAWNRLGLPEFTGHVLSYQISDRAVDFVASTASPMGSQIIPYTLVQGNWEDAGRPLIWAGQYLVLALTAAVAAGLLGLTLATFDRCLGRMSERGRSSRPVVLRPILRQRKTAERT
jgi:ABC-2 family transporter protein